MCMHTHHHLFELLPVKLGSLGEVLARNSQKSVLKVYLIHETLIEK